MPLPVILQILRPLSSLLILTRTMEPFLSKIMRKCSPMSLFASMNLTSLLVTAYLSTSLRMTFNGNAIPMLCGPGLGFVMYTMPFLFIFHDLGEKYLLRCFDIFPLQNFAPHLVVYVQLR